jgi:hypothetical protein
VTRQKRRLSFERTHLEPLPADLGTEERFGVGRGLRSNLVGHRDIEVTRSADVPAGDLQREVGRTDVEHRLSPSSDPVSHFSLFAIDRKGPVDLDLPKQEFTFVELLAPHPAGHLGVALARIA